VWNARKPQRLPEVIALPTSDTEVAEAVRLARSKDLRIAVRAGGHNIGGSGLREGGMLMDLSGLCELVVDARSPTALARAQPAVRSGELAQALGREGLAFPVGHCASVALGGYLLSGGLGWNMRAWGPACHSVERVEMVTADGNLVTADATENADLFWAARGAGPGFFGIVTRFFLRVHPLPQAIMTTSYLFPIDQVEEVCGWISKIAPDRPPTVELALVLRAAPPAARELGVSACIAVVATAFGSSEEEALGSLAVYDALPSRCQPVVHVSNQPATFGALHDMVGALLPEGHRYREDTMWSDLDVARLMPRIAEQFLRAPSGKSVVTCYVHPFVLDTMPNSPSAFSVQGDTFVFFDAIWEDEPDDGVNEHWLRATMASVEPHVNGHYVAGADALAHTSRSSRSFTPSSWERLARLKSLHDPDDVFFTYLGVDAGR
jgi:FAD/FMN-containing dehydrogenase